jgi:hypothetical protein
MALAYLFAPTTQFQARTGANLTAGFLRVFYTQTDDAAPTYSDFAATPNEEEIVLDADGRAVVIVDSTKTYRLEVYNRNHGLMFTVDPLTAVGGAGGSMAYSIVSTDGTVSIESTSSGGVIYYDLSTAISNEAAKWGARECAITSLDGSNDWQPLNTVSTVGSVTYYYGWKATKDTAYDFAASVEMPSGIAGATFGIDVKCEFLVDGVCVCTETGYIDPSRNVDRVSFEYKGQVDEGQKLDARLYARCAQALSGTLIGRVFYNEECDGVVGGESTGETYIPGEYIDISTANVISVTGVQPVSGMSSYVTQSAFDSCCSSMSGYVSSLSSDVSALSAEISGITGLTGDYVEKSAISGVSAIWNEASGVSSKLDASASGEFYSTSNPSGFITGVDLSNYATTGYVDSSVSGKVDETAYTAFTSQASADISSISSVVSGITGDWSGKADQSALDLKLDKSASSNFYPMTGNPSGFLTEHQELSGYVEKSAISAESAQWNEVSGLSGKLDASASGDFYSTSNPSGFITGVDLSEYATTSYVDSSVSGKADTSALTAYQPVSAMSGYQPSGDYAYNSSVSAKQDASAMSAYALSSDVSGVIDTVSANSATWAGGATGDYVEKSSTEVTIGSANTAEYTAFAQGTENSAYDRSLAQGSANTAYNGSLAQGLRNSAAYYSLAQGFGGTAGGTSFAQGNHNSARSCSFAQGEAVSASGTSFAQGMQTVAVGTSVAIGHYLQAANRMVAFGEHNISGDDLALVIGDGWAYAGDRHRHNLFEVKKSGDIVLYSGSADTAGWSVKDAVNAKLDASESSKFYSTSNPSGFITGIPTSYATKAYVDSSVSGKADTSSLTAYQPSGDYAYNSSLSSYALSADVSGVIDTVSANSATWAGISSDYVEKSAISAKSSVWNSASAVPSLLPKSAIEGSGSAITAINGSAILYGHYVEKSAEDVLFGYQNVLTPPLPRTATVPTLIQGLYNSGAMRSLVQGSHNIGVEAALAQGFGNSAESAALAQGENNTSIEVALSQGRSNSAGYSSLAQGVGNSASWISFTQGINNSAYGTSFAQGVDNSARAASLAQGSGCIATKTSIAVGHENSADMQSFAQGKWNSAMNRAAVFGVCNLHGDGDTSTGHSAALVIGDGTSKTARHDLMLVTKDGEITMFSSTADTTGTGIMSSLRALSAAASSVIDSATVSAIASSYAESAASGKLDSSASSSFYPVDNPSGFITGVDLSPYQLTADMSSYQPSGDYAYNSALSAYQPSGDYAYNSSVSGKADSSALTAYQEVTGMTAYQPAGDYQPSGDYIYASALGTGVI